MHLKRCDDVAKVSAVELHRADSQLTLLWEVTSTTGSTSDTFTLGVTPHGFDQPVSLTEPPQAGTHYIATVSLVGQTLKPTTEFDPRDLDSSSWHVSDGKAVSDAGFDRLSSC